MTRLEKMEKLIIEQAIEKYNSTPTPELDCSIRKYLLKKGLTDEVIEGYGEKYSIEDCRYAIDQLCECEVELEKILRSANEKSNVF